MSTTKYRLSIAFGLILCALVLIGFAIFRSRVAAVPLPGHYTLRVGTTTVTLEAARTGEELQRGLSGRENLAADQGMIFIFDRSDIWSFWMKDMNFPIDMIWLDDAHKIVFMQENATPESYPASFTPTVPARYVLELVSGFAQAHHLELGTTVNIK